MLGVEMKAKRSIQKHFALLTRFALICGFVIALTCAGPAGVAQENHEHHHHKKIYKADVNVSASRPLLDLLSHDYSIVDFDKLTPPFEIYPVLIGPDALANQDVTAYLVRAYRAGLTVAIVNATQKDANLFDELVEGEQVASCLPVPGTPRIALYALQRTTREQPEEVSRYCLPNFFQVGPRSDESDGQSPDRSGETEEQWLDAAFAPQPPPPPLQSDDDVSSSSSVNLDTIAQKTHCSVFHADANGQVQDDHFVTSARSFDSQRDYYYVQDFPKFISNRAPRFLLARTGELFVRRPGSREVPLVGIRLLFSQPSTTTAFVSEYTNSRSVSVSGTVGYQGPIPNVSATVSVTVGTSTTVTVPPVTILNGANLASGSTSWEFRPANPLARVLYDTSENWVWFVDRDVYGDTPNDIPEVLFSSIAATDSTSASDVCAFPPPFRTFTVAAPVITSVDPANVQRGGGTFLIRGARMYPGIVSNVLLGGDALPTSNFVPVSDTEIRVVVPSNQKTGLNAIQVNTSSNGTVLPSNTNIRVNVK
jgi:hypothetical protein